MVAIVAADIHYVGASDISSFLITTPKGHILIDTRFETTRPRIRERVEKPSESSRKAILNQP